jgi:hypothetical protein
VNLFEEGVNLFEEGVGLFEEGVNLFEEGVGLFEEGVSLFEEWMSLFEEGASLATFRLCASRARFIDRAFSKELPAPKRSTRRCPFRVKTLGQNFVRLFTFSLVFGLWFVPITYSQYQYRKQIVL